MEPYTTSHTEVTGLHQQMFKNYHRHFTMGKNEKYPTSRQSKYRKDRCDDPKEKTAMARPPRKNAG